MGHPGPYKRKKKILYILESLRLRGPGSVGRIATYIKNIQIYIYIQTGGLIDFIYKYIYIQTGGGSLTSQVWGSLSLAPITTEIFLYYQN